MRFDDREAIISLTLNDKPHKTETKIGTGWTQGCSGLKVKCTTQLDNLGGQ